MNLGVKKGYIMDIESNRELSGPVMKARSVLDQWHRSNGFMASHKMLIEAFVNQGDAHLAERVCRIAKKGQNIVVHIIMYLLTIICSQNWSAML